ncbi:N-6 DNA methylase [Rhodanobacter aciditrophus]|uniref:N-6 DNA methylase n=1 Tax=Rhodanobacter aciditrophus TaxID=1623218 RepID=UPI003CFB8318
MSEELLQTTPQSIGKYEYFKLGATTLGQLVAHGKIKKTAAVAKLLAKKPDGILTHLGRVIAVIEYKQPSTLRTADQIRKAIEQEIDVAKALCNVLIVTDGSKTIWVNAQRAERIQDRSGNELAAVFHPQNIGNVNQLEFILDQIRSSIDKKNSKLASTTVIDPTPLASRLWQTIWVATGKSPVKCLYNVVELFIFKFLSDLKVLDADYAFAKVYERSKVSEEKALEFYARNTRREILKLFPKSKTDETTIINGTIFVTETGAPNLTQAKLFARSLEHLNRYGDEFGSLTKIDKQFKTKLYESFLNQEVEAMGQYFTPRAIVQSVLRMGAFDDPGYSFAGKRFCDPFCGVGGFPLELLNINEGMQNALKPKESGKIEPNFTLHGFDKGFERDDERTIILAKANMLIYIAEILFAHPQCTQSFADLFNSTFRLFKDNLGTFGHIIKDESEKYDVILSNPPYVTSGSSIIKEELQSKAETKEAYKINALGLEGLSMEWIVNSLKAGGRAFVVIPDGILGRAKGDKLREFMLERCFLDGIVALPPRTFFSNAELTYILALTRKPEPVDGHWIRQTAPVFTYLVTNIGERLTSVRREAIDENDLPEMEKLFKVFMGSKTSSKAMLERESPRCKIQPFDKFKKPNHWVVDRWWNKEERVKLGLAEEMKAVSAEEITKDMLDLQVKLRAVKALYDKNTQVGASKEVLLGDAALFDMSIGERVLRKDLSQDAQDESLVPVFSSNVSQPFGYVVHKSFDSYSEPTIIWGIDGNFDFALKLEGYKFSITDHCGALRLKSRNISAEFLLYALRHQAVIESFDRSFRASLTNMKKFAVKIPVREDGSFDLTAQKKMAKQFAAVDKALLELLEAKREFDQKFKRFTAPMAFLA